MVFKIIWTTQTLTSDSLVGIFSFILVNGFQFWSTTVIIKNITIQMDTLRSITSLGILNTRINMNKQDSGVQGECPSIEDYSLEDFRTIAINNDDVPLYNRVIDVTPDYTIKLYKHDKVMGKLDFNGDKLKFEGDVEESAKVFIDFLLSTFNQRINKIKNEAYENGYKAGVDDIL